MDGQGQPAPAAQWERFWTAQGPMHMVLRAQVLVIVADQPGPRLPVTVEIRAQDQHGARLLATRSLGTWRMASQALEGEIADSLKSLDLALGMRALPTMTAHILRQAPRDKPWPWTAWARQLAF